MSPTWWNAVAPEWGTFLVEVALKSSLLIAGLLLADCLLGDRRASWRNLLWTAALAGLVLVPLASALLPALRVPVFTEAEPIVAVVQSHPLALEVPEGAGAPLQAAPPAETWGWASILLLVYGVGVCFFLGRLGVGLLYVSSLRRQAREVKDDRLLLSLHELRTRLGIRRPVDLGTSDQVGSPLQIGVFSPIAVLPAHLMDRLDDQTFRAVAVHELAHVRRWDYLLHLLAMVVLAFHWFNPLAWLAVRRLHETSEHACDELAVRLIGKYEIYARVLLDVLGEMRGQRMRWGLGMAYQAEERLERIMKMKNAIPVDVGRWAGGMVLASVAVGALILGCSTALTSKQSVLPGGGKSAYDGSGLDKAENCAAQQKWDEAKKAYKEALSKDSTLVRANLMIGRISYRQGAYDEAVRYLSKVPADVCWAALTLGWSYDATGERERAIEAYKRTLQLDPQESIATAARLGLAAPHSPRKMVKRDEGFKDVELPTVGWKAIADPNPEDAGKAFDRDPKTRWASKVPQSPGMSFQVDLGSKRVIDRVLLNDDADGTTIYVSDYPRGYTIEVSPDGKKWQMVASEDGDVNSYAGAFFEPMEAQYVRVIQKGSVEPEWWSIYEFVVFAPAP